VKQLPHHSARNPAARWQDRVSSADDPLIAAVDEAS
jgi:hypothetical protein